MSGKAPQESGVQELISRIRDDGVHAGQSKAEEIIAQARSEAARLVREATEEAQQTRDKAAAEIKSEQDAAGRKPIRRRLAGA